MEIRAFIGKGGVGKTTCAAASALFHAQDGKKVAIIDYDGGHSVGGALGIPQLAARNELVAAGENLWAYVVDTKDYVGIMEAKKAQMTTSNYLKQFSGDEGLVPFADMVTAFFGVPTDIPALQKFVILVEILLRLESEKFDEVVIDVEPTAGLERLLSNALTMAKSLRNLQKQGKVTLMVMGVKWPDIVSFIEGDYIQRADHYAERVLRVVKLLQTTTYHLVCIPEYVPANQTFEVRRVVERFGAQARACVVNNVRGEPHELEAIRLLKSHDLPLVKLARHAELHGAPSQDRLKMLVEMGASIHGTCL